MEEGRVIWPVASLPSPSRGQHCRMFCGFLDASVGLLLPPQQNESKVSRDSAAVSQGTDGSGSCRRLKYLLLGINSAAAGVLNI